MLSEGMGSVGVMREGLVGKDNGNGGRGEGGCGYGCEEVRWV